MKDVFEKWKDGEFPEEWQKKIDAFASAPVEGVSEEKRNFRAGFYIGLNIDAIKKRP